MSCDSFEWTCERCGKSYRDHFFTSYPREFWKGNKKCVGDVCERCRDEIDFERIIRSEKRKHGEWR